MGKTYMEKLGDMDYDELCTEFAYWVRLYNMPSPGDTPAGKAQLGNHIVDWLEVICGLASEKAEDDKQAKAPQLKVINGGRNG